MHTFEDVDGLIVELDASEDVAPAEIELLRFIRHEHAHFDGSPVAAAHAIMGVTSRHHVQNRRKIYCNTSVHLDNVSTAAIGYGSYLSNTFLVLSFLLYKSGGDPTEVRILDSFALVNYNDPTDKYDNSTIPLISRVVSSTTTYIAALGGEAAVPLVGWDARYRRGWTTTPAYPNALVLVGFHPQAVMSRFLGPGMERDQRIRALVEQIQIFVTEYTSATPISPSPPTTSSASNGQGASPRANKPKHVKLVDKLKAQVAEVKEKLVRLKRKMLDNDDQTKAVSKKSKGKAKEEPVRTSGDEEWEPQSVGDMGLEELYRLVEQNRAQAQRQPGPSRSREGLSTSVGAPAASSPAPELVARQQELQTRFSDYLQHRAASLAKADAVRLEFNAQTTSYNTHLRRNLATGKAPPFAKGLIENVYLRCACVGPRKKTLLKEQKDSDEKKSDTEASKRPETFAFDVVDIEDWHGDLPVSKNYQDLRQMMQRQQIRAGTIVKTEEQRQEELKKSKSTAASASAYQQQARAASRLAHGEEIAIPRPPKRTKHTFSHTPRK
ncbi:hypothetical protein OIV83_002995 [Microbotryomycetes sp. JL201]|nr:hypothetical protein OIV83_002995 [Microbotryomycetes sp. JL201]